jgi:hypothetical protein
MGIKKKGIRSRKRRREYKGQAAALAAGAAAFEKPA